MNEYNGDDFLVISIDKPYQEDGKVKVKTIENEQALNQRVVIISLESKILFFNISLGNRFVSGSENHNQDRVDNGCTSSKALFDKQKIEIFCFFSFRKLFICSMFMLPIVFNIVFTQLIKNHRDQNQNDKHKTDESSYI